MASGSFPCLMNESTQYIISNEIFAGKMRKSHIRLCKQWILFDKLISPCRYRRFTGYLSERYHETDRIRQRTGRQEKRTGKSISDH